MNNKIVLSSLALDLKRVALGLHRNSIPMAERFYSEALKRIAEIQLDIVPPHIRNIVYSFDTFKQKSIQDQAEYSLMYSTLIQNYALTLP